MSPIAQPNLPNRLDLPLRLGALLVLVTGLGLGLFTLSSALGIWVGAWDWRTGLGILRMANAAGGYVFWGCLVAGVLLALLSILLTHSDKNRLVGYIFIGVLSALDRYPTRTAAWCDGFGHLTEGAAHRNRLR